MMKFISKRRQTRRERRQMALRSYTAKKATDGDARIVVRPVIEKSTFTVDGIVLEAEMRRSLITGLKSLDRVR